MLLETIIGIGIFLAIFAYMIFNLDEEHIIFKLFGVMVIFFLMSLIPAKLVSHEVCDFVPITENVTGNITTYTYNNICVDYENTNNSIFLKSVLWLSRIFAIYMFLYLSYKILLQLINRGQL